MSKSRHILLYMSGFFLLVFALITLSSFKPDIKTKKLPHSPDTDDTIYVYDTVYYYDTTFVYDTVYVPDKIKQEKLTIKKSNFWINKSSNLIPFGKYLFSFDLFFSPMYSIHSFQSDFIYKEVSAINKNAVQEDLSSSLGFGINFHKPFMTYSSGLNYTQYKENFNFLETKYIIDTVTAYNLFTEIHMQIDSIPLINIDTLLATGDTVYYYYKDTNYVEVLDSNLVQRIDSIDYQANEKTTNSYSYIEIPLILSFNIYRTNYYFSPQFGIFTSFFVSSDGKIVSLTNLNQSNSLKDEAKFTVVNLSVYAGLSFNYFLTRKLDFFTSAYFRKNIYSVYKDYPIISRFNSFGLKVGLRYKFTF